jgi:IS30 family transposase
MKSKELTFSDREEISRLLVLGASYSKIGKLINKDKSCISREVSRRGLNRRTYRAWLANQYARGEKKKQGRKNKLETQLELRQVVFSWLRKNWSPGQIAERLKIKYPERKDMHIAPETIYSYLYVRPKEQLRKELIKHLRRQKKYRLKRRKKIDNCQETRGKIPAMVSIDDRPDEINDRMIPGHWEGDLIVGRFSQSALGSLAERTTRMTYLVPLKKTDPETVRKAFARALKQLPKHLKLSLTYDRGKEMAQHQLFTKKTKIKVYFAHKSSPWERGTNENTNGLVRQYFPKGTDFKMVSHYQIKRVQDSLNNRPRKCLNFETPLEVFSKLLQ